MYNIQDYGAVGDGIQLNTVAIQAAIDDCGKNGGGTVFIPCGTYLAGSIHLKSNINLYFETGAKLLGSKDLDNHFDPDEAISYPLYQDVSHSYFHHSLIWGENLENIAITGLGTIDMQSAWEKDDTRWPMRRGAKIIALKKCKHVTITDLTLLNSTDLAVYLAGCETVRISKITADVHIDGISPDCCKDVIISDCIIRSGDDAIVPKSSYTLNRLQMCENVVITNCIISSRCNAIKLGTESNAGYRNFSISNCTIYNTRFAGIALEAVDGGILEGVSISNISMKNVGTPFFIILADRRRGPQGTGMGSIRNITIDNIVVTGPYESWTAKRESIECGSDIQEPICVTSTITGQPGHCIKNIRLSNIRMVVLGGGLKEDAEICVPEDPKSYPESTRFGLKLPSYAFYCRHCEEISFYNVSVGFEIEDERPAFIFDDVKGLRLHGVECSTADSSIKAVQFKENVSGIKEY